MSYFPKHYIKTNLYTVGGEFVLRANQQIYVGPYWQTGNGKYYTGKTPQGSGVFELIKSQVINNLEPLYSEPLYTDKIKVALLGDAPEIGNGNEPYIESNVLEYTNLKKLLVSANGIKYLPPFNITIPTQQDYQNSEFRRYFAKKSNELQYIEISQQTYAQLVKRDPVIEWSLYQPFNIPWQLTGNIDQVEKTNRNIVELTIQKNNLYKFNEYLKFDYTKYYNQLGTSTSGSYINGVNQGYVLDNRDRRINGVSNSQNDSGSVRRDSSITR
jgi:hypothetical protein